MLLSTILLSVCAITITLGDPVVISSNDPASHKTAECRNGTSTCDKFRSCCRRKCSIYASVCEDSELEHRSSGIRTQCVCLEHNPTYADATKPINVAADQDHTAECQSSSQTCHTFKQCCTNRCSRENKGYTTRCLDLPDRLADSNVAFCTCINPGQTLTYGPIPASGNGNSYATFSLLLLIAILLTGLQ